jgi:hypothetical protein
LRWPWPGGPGHGWPAPSLGALCQPVDGERIERLDVADGDVQQEVLLPGRDEDAERLRKPAGPLAEGLDGPPGRGPDAHRDEGLHRPAERGQIHVQDGAPDGTVGELDEAIARLDGNAGQVRVIEVLLDKRDLLRVLSDTAKAEGRRGAQREVKRGLLAATAKAFSS